MNTENLLKLADYLDALPKTYTQFGMTWFQKRTRTNGNSSNNQYADPFAPEDIPEINVCGTTACAIGHGPLAGFPVELSDQNWWAYSERVFGLDPDSQEWIWCFSGDWDDYDNTPYGAAARIRQLVETGEIGSFPWLEPEEI